MGKTPERRVFTSASSSGALRYRRKAPAPADNQQPEQQPEDIKQHPADIKQQLAEPKEQQQQKQEQSEPQPHRSNNSNNRNRSSRSPPARRFRPKPRQPKQQQPALLKQLLWKAKAVQPAPPLLTLTKQQQRSRNQEEEDDDEDEEVAFAREQRQARKLLASEAEALAAKNKAVVVAALPSSESFVAESSSQETQSGSEDEAVFLPYSDLLPSVQASPEWQVFKEQEDAEETDGEEDASPVMPSRTAETPVEKLQKQPEQDELEKTAVIRRKRQRSKLKLKQKRAAAKEQKRFQDQQIQVHKDESERVCPAEEDAGSTQDDDSNIFHPPTNLASEMDAGVCRAVLSQLNEVVPYIVVGDVACPMVPSDEKPSVSADEAEKEEPEETVVDFRQHVIAMLNRSKETQIQYRESFVVENSGFDAASSYDFLKSRFYEIQRSTGIVYY
ncbi:hypothetical protein L914_20180 [Phytophthora nicotianae]|uniref:Uncharacterized protein n=1 Tax=Phytophthora nicotianae TaxID=4792 RepID=W2M9Y5_PHYNI|nr:hypothetical protein L914_20180 [Phytophthora nicotianae]